MKKFLCLILCLFTVLSLTSCLEEDTLYKETGGENQGQENQGNQGNRTETFSLNETAVFTDLKFTASEIKESGGDNFFVPEDGNVFVGIKFTIENISSETQTISSLLLFEAYCDDIKCAYSLSAELVFDDGTLDGELAPGKKLVGWYAVEVPEGWSTIELAVQAEWLSNTTAMFVFEK